MFLSTHIYEHLTIQKNDSIFHIWSDWGFKVAVVNRTLPSLFGGSLEITLTISFKLKKPPYLNSALNGLNLSLANDGEYVLYFLSVNVGHPALVNVNRKSLLNLLSYDKQ